MATEAASHAAKAAVTAVPLFRRLGLRAVPGQRAAGLAIGPWGLGFFFDAMSILHVAEPGVVMFLFIIGLKMQPSRLWSMRRDIFGLGLFLLAVGMAPDLAVVRNNRALILVTVVAFIVLQMTGIHVIARAFRARHPGAHDRMVLMAQGGPSLGSCCTGRRSPWRRPRPKKLRC